MAMNIEFDAYKQKLNDCKPALDGLADSLNLQGLRNELERYHAMQEAPGFWDDPEKSQKIVVKAKITESKIEKYESIRSKLINPIYITEIISNNYTYYTFYIQHNILESCLENNNHH